MGYDNTKEFGPSIKTDGAVNRKLRISDMVMMVADHPGWTQDQIHLRMLALHGLTWRTVDGMLKELVRLCVFEVRAVKLATDDPDAPQVGMGYYPLANAKIFFGER